jgi:anti-sigma regulatory factor (Ser/Thr protein kinase)
MYADRQLSSCITSTAALVAPTPVRHAEATAPALAQQARELRRRAATHLASWALDEDDHDAALLVAAELLANAVQHGRSRMTLTLTRHPQLLHISVADHGARRDHRAAGSEARAAIDPDEHGRGLAIVAALAAWVEVVHDDTGYQVWAALPLSAPPASPNSSPRRRTSPSRSTSPSRRLPAVARPPQPRPAVT